MKSNKYEKILKEEESIEILRILDLASNIVPKDMAEENIGQKFRLTEIDKARNYFIEEIKQNDWITKTHKKIFKTLDYIEHLFILVCTVTGCVSISAFVSLVSIGVGVASFVITIKTSIITAGIKKYKSIIKKKKYNEILLLAKTKLNTVEVLISKALIDSNIRHEKFVLANNMKNEDMKEEIKNSNKK